MKLTLIAIGSTGDVRPFVLLGRELSARGHQITVVAFARFSSLVQAEGFSFHPLCGSAESFMDAIMQPDTSAVTYLPRLKKEISVLVPHIIQDILSGSAEADAIICNFFGSVHYSVAEKLNIPCIQIYYFPMDPTHDMPISSFRHQNWGSRINWVSYKLGYLMIGSLEHFLLTDWRKSNQLRVRKPGTAPDYRIGNHVIPCIYAVSPCILPRPAEWGDHIHLSGYWFDQNPPEWEAPSDLERFLSEDPVPPVYIGFGSMSGIQTNKLLSVILRALHETRIRAVIAIGWTEKQYRSNHRVFFADYIPHDWLFPRVRAVVHHGGSGTTAAGLKYGLPSLIIPFAGDQPFWGDHVYKAGCGPKPIACRNLSLRKITSALLDLVTRSRYRENALRISRDLAREDGLRTACDLIEKGITEW